MSSTKASLSFVPKFLPFGPPPMLEELASSWLGRVATANAVTLEELLACVGFGEWAGASPGFMPDLGMPAAGRRRLAALCRLPEGSIEALDLQRQFPGRGANWFRQRHESLGLPQIEPGFCPECIREQVRRGEPAHLRAEWALASVTHCPLHLLPLEALLQDLLRFHKPCAALGSIRNRAVQALRRSAAASTHKVPKAPGAADRSLPAGEYRWLSPRPPT